MKMWVCLSGPLFRKQPGCCVDDRACGSGRRRGLQLHPLLESL